MEEKVWEGGEGVMKKDTISSQAALSVAQKGGSVSPRAELTVSGDL